MFFNSSTVVGFPNALFFFLAGSGLGSARATGGTDVGLADKSRELTVSIRVDTTIQKTVFLRTQWVCRERYSRLAHLCPPAFGASMPGDCSRHGRGHARPRPVLASTPSLPRPAAPRPGAGAVARRLSNERVKRSAARTTHLAFLLLEVPL